MKALRLNRLGDLMRCLRLMMNIEDEDFFLSKP